MREFADIVSAVDVEAGAGVNEVVGSQIVANKKTPVSCPICNGSGFILQPNGQARLCRCHIERRFQRACRQARLQPALQKMTFESFDLANYPGNAVPEGMERSYLELAREASAKMLQCCQGVLRDKNPRGLLLLGQVGSGKTHLAAAAANYLLRRQSKVLFLVVPDFLDELKSNFSGSYSQEYEVRRLQERAKTTETLILDDLGSHNFSDWTRSVLFSILNYRMNECLTTIVTSNLEVASLQDMLGTRSLSRLLALCEPCLLVSDCDIRLKGLEKE